jgi:hypothetical protein
MNSDQTILPSCSMFPPCFCLASAHVNAAWIACFSPVTLATCVESNGHRDRRPMGCLVNLVQESSLCGSPVFTTAKTSSPLHRPSGHRRGCDTGPMSLLTSRRRIWVRLWHPCRASLIDAEPSLATPDTDVPQRRRLLLRGPGEVLVCPQPRRAAMPVIRASRLLQQPATMQSRA